MMKILFGKEEGMKKHMDLRHLLFLVICCDLGLFSKRLISPLANIVTDFLHIPGGISHFHRSQRKTADP